MKLFCIIGLFLCSPDSSSRHADPRESGGREDAYHVQDGPEGCWEGGGREETGRRIQETTGFQ